MTKRILVIAKNNQAEALRVAAGLTLLDHSVKVDVVGAIEDRPEVHEQREVLEFADIPCDVLDDSTTATGKLARDILEAEAVYTI